MPGDLWGFVLVKAPSGRRMLLNLDATLAILESEDGTGEAISLAGIKHGTGNKFEEYLQDIMGRLE